MSRRFLHTAEDMNVNLGSPIICHTGGTWTLLQQLVKLLTSLGVYESSGTASSCVAGVSLSLLVNILRYRP